MTGLLGDHQEYLEQLGISINRQLMVTLDEFRPHYDGRPYIPEEDVDLDV